MRNASCWRVRLQGDGRGIVDSRAELDQVGSDYRVQFFRRSSNNGQVGIAFLHDQLCLELPADPSQLGQQCIDRRQEPVDNLLMSYRSERCVDSRGGRPGPAQTRAPVRVVRDSLCAQQFGPSRVSKSLQNPIIASGKYLATPAYSLRLI